MASMTQRRDHERVAGGAVGRHQRSPGPFPSFGSADHACPDGAQSQRGSGRVRRGPGTPGASPPPRPRASDSGGRARALEADAAHRAARGSARMASMTQRRDHQRVAGGAVGRHQGRRGPSPPSVQRTTRARMEPSPSGAADACGVAPGPLVPPRRPALARVTVADGRDARSGCGASRGAGERADGEHDPAQGSSACCRWGGGEAPGVAGALPLLRFSGPRVPGWSPVPAGQRTRAAWPRDPWCLPAAPHSRE